VADAVRSAEGLSAPELATHVEGLAVSYAPHEPIDDMAVLALVANPE
jgi:hypothetical protein